MHKLDWIQVHGGGKVRPLHLREQDIDISVIAHALSMQCRFGGHCLKFYSVAEHCVRASKIVHESDALWALLHDASEAYLLDIPRPIKYMDEFYEYRQAEKRAMETICNHFKLPIDEPKGVKHADEVMLATEARDLMQPLHPEWSEWLIVEPLIQHITPWHPEQAEHNFMVRFHELTKKPEARPEVDEMTRILRSGCD